MNSADLIQMIGNLSRSLFPVQSLISGLAYILGILFFMTAIAKLRKIGDYRANSSSQEKMFGPIAYIVGGAALLFLPSAVASLSNTAFGVGNILQYANYNPTNIYSSMDLVIRTAGLIWFVRGAVLLTHASEPGVQDGPKGLAFLAGGVFAMNFDNTIAFMGWIVNQLTSLALTFRYV
ncbi:type IV secretion protein IcmC [Legionella genomosp. 1]|uniref:type IV secretion protein IcmC n=1 Tax=Legionella genomosp. 1 TaxID=1093625 RepID=UPI001056BB5F|nr:type IV secretion protein IcmC [Legionella genomosp. 1]